MKLETLRTFFGWCTLINIGILMFNTVTVLLLGDVAENLHGNLFKIDPVVIRQSFYSYLAFHKIAFIVFSLVPWLALVVMTRDKE